MTHSPVLSTRAENSGTRTPLSAWTLSLGAQRDAAPPAVLSALADGIVVVVPGSVLGALVERSLVRDVTLDGTEEELAWHSECSWHYTASVPRQRDGTHVRLVFDGVDTVATIRVDGQVRAKTDDMFHRWVIDLGADDRDGAWEVDVEFIPALAVAQQAEAAHPLPRADMYELPYNQVRKMACSFGWDWGPTTITCGLWRDVVVERHGAARIDKCFLDGGWSETGMLHGSVQIDGPASYLTVTVADNHGATVAEARVDVAGSSADFVLSVPQAVPWNVRGRGDQPLYSVGVVLVDGSGGVVDRLERRVGFRDITVAQAADPHGNEFAVRVNGQRVWARGFNWIPADVLPERVTRERVRSLLADVVATGANMLRVWGGGVVESDDFYDACDEFGLLVWQDFSFACAAYAEDDAQAARVTREVEDAVRRVGHHPALALWCGCNENLWGYEDWGWKEKLGEGGAWGARLYHDVIPAALAAIDPRRPYIPGSPFSPDMADHPNDPRSGTTHHWDMWNELDYGEFEKKKSRFASEFGWQAPCAWPTLLEALGGPPTGGDDPRIVRLQKAFQGTESLQRGVEAHLGHLPTHGPHWHAAAQIVQARALRTSIGHFRSMHDSCSGALWWQFDDCWPALSWSVVDVAGRRKLAWYAAAEVMADRVILPTAVGSPEGFTLVNDTAHPWETEIVWRAVDESGIVLSELHSNARVPADGHLVLDGPTPEAAIAVVADAAGLRAVKWLRDDAELPVAPTRVDVSVDATQSPEGRVVVKVEAGDMVRDLSLLAERLPALTDAVVDRQLRTLLPGEVAAFCVSGSGVADISALEWSSVLAASTVLNSTVEDC
ncbi:hypothetical protein [Demequina sp.]|uniref:glycoside hydrolase family 2 protein n=1 Tax=Demequina sp. TaxID=2050685 RepID=UPI0025BD0849|nr:hypothetical protein [Demequina sp.]